jgi:murein DD-endopeptidase MepM/ murein hydrolase activator NlpD
MKIILLSKFCHKSGSRSLSLPKLGAWLGLVVTAIAGGSLWAGYQYGIQETASAQESDRAVEALQELLARQREELVETRQRTGEHLDALALRLGQMQSHILRINALGERLALHGNLDIEEFDFDQEPARGGIASSEESASIDAKELIEEMEQISRTIEDREHKLELMEGLLLSNKVKGELTPAGRPTRKGWISSRYGYRKDPFTGKKAFHHGVDIAGKKNSDVVAVASGVVTFAGKKSGYGYLVEVRHADGYETRYGHNSEIFVKAGDLVTQGQRIGLMGSSGRSTGPHVHFEIARNGKTVNPSKYLKATR